MRVANDAPMRHHHDRLVDEFKSALGLADRFDGERPDVRRLMPLEFDVDPLPLIAKSQRSTAGKSSCVCSGPSCRSAM